MEGGPHVTCQGNGRERFQISSSSSSTAEAPSGRDSKFLTGSRSLGNGALTKFKTSKRVLLLKIFLK